MVTMSRQQAADAVAKAQAERDTIQSNLLDLDGSFGKRLLTGAQLTGTTKQRWDTAAATLAVLWDTYATYSSVVDRAVTLVAGKLGQRELTEVTGLLTLPSVEVTRGPAPLGRRDLADTGRDQLTLSAAVARMRTAFAEVADLVAAAEQAWNSVAGPLDAAAADLAHADSLGDEALAAELAEVRAELDRQRAALNSDPLVAQVTAASRVRDRAAAVAAKAAELARVRAGAVARIAALRADADAARTARDDAVAAAQRVAAKIAGVPPVPDFGVDPATRLARLDALLAAGRWTRLSSELDLLENELTSAALQFNDAERTVVTLLSKRDELRGLLDAYKAKAGRLGAAEDPDLARLYDQTRELLWTAPCDLTAAADAVTRYQQAVLAIGARRL
ncbi:MAG: hypothetical protein JO345_21000 [Streptosporangiaceae bacterium]|nr:hypothetical protein [Streptosporangiaceae bacterium]